MADNRDPLFREIDEEMRREQLLKLWNAYGTYMILGVAVLLLGVFGYQWMQKQRAAQAEAAGARYSAVATLLQQGKNEQAQQDLEAIANGGPAGYGALARLQLAALAMKAGRADEAYSRFTALAADSGADPLLRDFAQLQAASLKLDTAGWTEMQNRLTPLLGDKSPWRYSARELLGLAAFRAGELDEARKALTELVADQKVPASIRERAQALMAVVTGENSPKPGPAGTGEQPATGSAGTSGAGGTPAAKAQ